MVFEHNTDRFDDSVRFTVTFTQAELEQHRALADRYTEHLAQPTIGAKISDALVILADLARAVENDYGPTMIGEEFNAPRD